MRWIIILQLLGITVASIAAGLIHAHYSPDRTRIEELIPDWHEAAARAATARLQAAEGVIPGRGITLPSNGSAPDSEVEGNGADEAGTESVPGFTLEYFAGKKNINLAEAKFLWDEGEATFVDARAYEAYKEGHIAEAIAIPYDVLRQGNPLPHLEHGIIFPGETRLVIYCKGGDCDESLLVAQELRSMGFTSYVFLDGYPPWVEAGYDIAEGGDPWLIAFEAEPDTEHDH